MSVYKVTLAHAVGNELGGLSGGKPGDQLQDSTNNAGELRFSDWYISGGVRWDCVLHCTDNATRKKIAADAIKAVRNVNIGYSQDKRYGLYDDTKPYGFDAEKTTKAVDCDCSSLATVCANYAGIAIPRDTYTGNMQKVYVSTKMFKAYTSDKYCTSPSSLKRGDLLVRAGHHTAIVANIYYHMTRELYYKSGKLMVGGDVMALQQRLNDLMAAGLVVDGELGKKTAAAIRQFQEDNLLEVDEIAGRETLEKAGFLYC